MPRLAFVCLVIVSLSCAAFAADDASIDRGMTCRGKLGQPSPIDAVSFEGDITIGGLWAGTVSLEARPHTFARQEVWRVVEKLFIDYKGVEKHIALRYMLSPALSLRSGRADVDIEGTKIATVFGPTAKGFQVIRTTTPHKGKTKTENLTYETPSKATTGTPTLMLFARAVKADFTEAHALPWFPLMDLALGQNPGRTTGRYLMLTPMPENERMQVGWGFVGADGDKKWSVHLSSDRKRLVRMEGPDFKIVPKGQGGERVTLREEKPATTWQAAFLKFGYGYHMARKKLLQEAFHWKSMYEHETKVTKSWKGTDDLDKFRDAWVAEFLRQSLHRPRADTERLLNMTLASGKVTKEGDDKVIFAAHKNFGGGTQRTYTLKRVDGIWYIAYVKF